MLKERHTILCVDDEPENLRSLRRILRPHHNVLLAESAAEALQLLQQQKVALIISDQRMPGLTGVEFLTQTIALCPDAIRILLTGYTDATTLVEAINSGQIYRYITKPWEPSELLLVITRALESYALASENKRLMQAMAVHAAKAEEAAKRETALRQQWEATFNSLHEGLFIFSRAAVLQRANQAGRSLAQRLGVSCVPGITRLEQLFPNQAELSQEFGLLEATAPRLVELSLHTLHETLAVEITLTPDNSVAEQGNVLLIVRDVTSQNQLKRQLARAEKMSALGQLVSGVAHELNNPLTSVIGYTQLIQFMPHLTTEMQSHLGKIFSEAMRARKIVQNLLTFARQHAPERQNHDLNSIIEQVLELRDYHLRVNQIEVRKQLTGAPIPVNVDNNQLQQVLLNIIINAEQALLADQRSGRLDIETSVAQGMAQLVISDNGPGIPPEYLHRIFDPFFTTKEVGKGTGLGLSISYGIMEAHDGRISVSNRQPHGASFRLELPLAQAYQPCDTATRNEQPTVQGGGRVLVVDDEELLRGFVRNVLANHDFLVDEADSGEAALELLQTTAYDLILTDLKMPGFSGAQLFARIQESWPLLAERLVFMTGDNTNEMSDSFLRQSGRPCLEKPFNIAELLDIVARATDLNTTPEYNKSLLAC